MTIEQQESPIQTTDEAVTDVNAAPETTNETNVTPESTEEPSKETLLGDIDDSADGQADVSDTEDGAEGEAEEPAEPIEYDLKLPENAQIDDTELAEVGEFAKANNLSAEAAQEVVERVNRAAEGALQKAVATYEQEIETNRQALLSHPELGRDNMKKTDQLATAALSRFDKGGELTKLLQDGGHHVNPVVISYLVEIGKALSPDTLHLGGARSGRGDSESDKLNRMFPPEKLKQTTQGT